MLCTLNFNNTTHTDNSAITYYLLRAKTNSTKNIFVTLFGNTALANVASVIVAVEISSWQFLVCMCVFTIFSKWLWELRFHLKEVTMD